MSRSSAKVQKSQKAQAENGITRYIRETREEIAKVTWPTREEGTRLTWIVFVVTMIAAVALFGVDYIFGTVIGWLIRLT